jgi:long-chain acyl-CoA synthetase
MTHRNLSTLHGWQADRLGPRPALRFKRHGLYHDYSWADYRADALACAAALAEAGVRPGDRVGLLGENRVEWLVADMGLLAAAAVNVPPHAPLSARQVHFQIADSDAVWLFVSTRAQMDKVRQVRGELPLLKGVVAFDRDVAGEDAIPWTTFLQRGRQALPRLLPELRQREAALGPDDLATIMYTSGTTGNPKGVMLTHENLLSNADAVLQLTEMVPDDVVLNWLPLSHIYARTCDHYTNLMAGVTVCLADSADTVVLNLAEVQPTRMSSVPRLYEKVLAAVGTGSPEDVGKRIRGIFGPRVRWLTSGGAPLPPAIAETYKAAGVLVLQGYGLTETSPVISFNRPQSYKLETVGRAIPGVEIAVGPDGEVLTRGPHVMRGYWKNPGATAECIRDGWFHTGDLGEIDADGFLKITGRKKELMVLSNGKKVVPNYLEGLLLADECIDQAVVSGEARNFLTALVVPHWDNLRKALRGEGRAVDGQGEEALAASPAVREFLQRRIDAALADEATYEQVRKIVVLPQPFTVAAEELTVSLKLRRNVVLTKYAPQLDALYRE